MDYVHLAIKAAGDVPVVAEHFDLSHEAVYKWRRRCKVPSNRVIDLCALGRWQVSPHQLCPTFYPQPQDGIPNRGKLAKRNRGAGAPQP